MMHNSYCQLEGMSTAQPGRQVKNLPDGGIVAQPRMATTTLADRLRTALAAHKPKLSGQKLETLAGLPRGYVSRILNGSRKKLGPDMIEPMARVLGVDYRWLATGAQPGELAAAGASPVPPAAERVTEDDGLMWLVGQAWNKDEHMPADIATVQAFAKQRGPLLRRDVEMVGLVRVWLDTASHLRRKGKTGTVLEMIDALTSRAGRAEFVDAYGRSEEDIRGDEEYHRQTGQTPPGWAGPFASDATGETPTPPKTLRPETPKPPTVASPGSVPKSSGRSRK
jgi:transcriptional regulator with XRE-family HTH domain